MRIAIAQLNPTVGSLDRNFELVKKAYERACDSQARLLLTPELCLNGYPPHDLVERPETFTRTEAALEKLAALTSGKSCALVVGAILKNPKETGKKALNSAVVFEKGKQVFTQSKSLLPTYDIFDESRYFEPSKEVSVWNCDGKKIALGICEDFWAEDEELGRIYARDPVDDFQKMGVDLALSVSSSPYEKGKRARREMVHGQVAKKLKAPLAYVNQWGANDEILFDGASFVVGADGKLTHRLPVFAEGFGVFEYDFAAKAWKGETQFQAQEKETDADAEWRDLKNGLVVGIRDYFRKTGFSRALLGLSGGVDSALIAVLAAEALGPENVLAVAMPSQYSASISLEDAETLARDFRLRFEVRPIKFLFSQALREWSEGRGKLADLAQENMQSRLRGNILMTLSNHYGALVLTTGNKSELATGYCTLYGDMCGALAPIGDLYKTQVYGLCDYLNRTAKRTGQPLIPERILTRAPSAELRPNQTDQDSLPPYEFLDLTLQLYLEKRLPQAEIESEFKRLGKPTDGIKKTLRLVEINEYKRRQAPPVLKVSQKAFGMGRRMPVAKEIET
ncbi:MAG: NAD+ synthase [Bdellovibrionales bacterium]|nr:NAD+ synthase [Bdellovibrionales bacterium]